MVKPNNNGNHTNKVINTSYTTSSSTPIKDGDSSKGIIMDLGQDLEDVLSCTKLYWFSGK